MPRNTPPSGIRATSNGFSGDNMAEKIRGITIEIGGDTKGLTNALKGVNKEIKNTQAQLKDVDKLLKLDPGNTELLAQKQRLLADAAKESADKVDELYRIEKQMKDAGIDENSEQFMALRREIISAEASLKDAKKASDNFSVSMEKVSVAAGKVSSAAGKISSATRGLSTAAGAGVAGIVGLGVKAAQSADELNTLSKQSGITTEELQKMQYAADLVDVDADTIIGGLRKLKKNMVSTSKDTVAAWERIGVTVTDTNGDLRDSNEVFYEVLQGLSQISNETERDTVAMTLFGKSADDLAGIIDDGGEALKLYGQQAKDLGYILDQDTLDSMNEVNDTLDQLKMKAQGTLATTGAKALEALTPVIEKVVDAAGKLLEKIGEMSPETIQLITTILALVAAISPIAGLVAKVSGAISTIAPLLKGVSLATAGVVAAIVAAVALIAVKGDEIQALLQKVDDFVQNIFAKDMTEVFGPVLGEVFNSFLATIKNVWDAIIKVFDGIIDFIRGVFTGDWKRAWEGVKSVFSGIFDGLAAILKAPLNAVIGLINGAISGINAMIRGLNKISFTIPDWVPVLGGKRFGLNIRELGKIPYLANGGVLSEGSAVVGEAGPELLTMMGGKARVEPLTNNTTNTTNLGGVNITVYGAPGQDVRQLANIIMDEMQAATERRAAALA